MIRRKPSPKAAQADVEPKSFDDFDLRLGDLMRGERATLGKSLLDVQRELRIKASYIAAIENAEPSAFDTPGFIAGYVRSYARYLGMDPEKAFKAFCVESGFSIAHGMSDQASSIRKNTSTFSKPSAPRDPFMTPNTPFAMPNDGFLARIEPGAIGSVMVLVALIGAIGYGGWSVLNEIQRVQYAPVENTPNVLSDLDPLQTAARKTAQTDSPATDASEDVVASGVFAPPNNTMDRLYRPQALDVPVMVARDAPISTLDPSTVGSFASEAVEGPIMAAINEAMTAPQVIDSPAPELAMVAARPAWVRVQAADGRIIFEGIMNAGDRYVVPSMEEPPVLRVGESGAIYFAMNGAHYGPVGPRGSVTSNLALSSASLAETYAVADLETDGDLARVVAELQTVPAPSQ